MFNVNQDWIGRVELGNERNLSHRSWSWRCARDCRRSSGSTRRSAPFAWRWCTPAHPGRRSRSDSDRCSTSNWTFGRGIATGDWSICPRRLENPRRATSLLTLEKYNVKRDWYRRREIGTKRKSSKRKSWGEKYIYISFANSIGRIGSTPETFPSPPFSLQHACLTPFSTSTPPPSIPLRVENTRPFFSRNGKQNTRTVFKCAALMGRKDAYPPTFSRYWDKCVSTCMNVRACIRGATTTYESLQLVR